MCRKIKYEVTEAKDGKGRIIRKGEIKEIKLDAYNEGQNCFMLLLTKYANGRKLCNCRQAYETPVLCETVGGDAVISSNCHAGCSANQIDAKYEVAEKAAREIGDLKVTIALLDSIIKGGESHSETSKEAVRKAFNMEGDK